MSEPCVQLETIKRHDKDISDHNKILTNIDRFITELKIRNEYDEKRSKGMEDDIKEIKGYHTINTGIEDSKRQHQYYNYGLIAFFIVTISGILFAFLKYLGEMTEALKTIQQIKP